MAAIGLFEQAGDFHAQPSRYPIEAFDGWISQAPLNAANIRAMESRRLCKRFLRGPSLLAEKADPFAKRYEDGVPSGHEDIIIERRL